jgi:hypothetical protein
MSALSQSGALLPYTEIIPDNLRAGGLTKASSIVERRRIRVVPQGGANYGSVSAGTGAGNSQIQFLIAGDGMIDCRSAVLNYTIFTSGSNVVPDDGGPFVVQQTILNGTVVDNVTNAAKVANAQFKLGVSKSYYCSAGSYQGFQLLNNDLVAALPLAGTASITASDGQYGYVSNNLAPLVSRAQRATGSGVLGNNGLQGMTQSIPLAVLGNFWKISQALPLGILGEINLTLVTGSASDVLFSGVTAATPDYSLGNVSLEYDVLIPSNDLMMLYKQVAMDPADAGLNYVVESSICTQAGSIGTAGTAATALNEYVAIASRSTNNLVRSTLLLVNAVGMPSVQFPSQSCFSWANTYSVGWRIGSQTFPQISPQGPAAIFNMSLNSYGSAMTEHGTAVNRLLWTNSTDASTLTTVASYTAASENTTAKFTYADSFMPTYSFEQVRGGYEKPSLQGVSLSGASGSQLICSFVAAPPTSYNVYLIVTALKVIKAQAASVRVEGA